MSSLSCQGHKHTSALLSHKVCSCMPSHMSWFGPTHKHTHNATELCPPHAPGSQDPLAASRSRYQETPSAAGTCAPPFPLCSAPCTSAQIGWEENTDFKLEKQPQSVFWSLCSVGSDSSRWTNRTASADADGGTWTDILQISAPELPRWPNRLDHTLWLLWWIKPPVPYRNVDP